MSICAAAGQIVPVALVLDDSASMATSDAG